jgi:hypothetical protein
MVSPVQDAAARRAAWFESKSKGLGKPAEAMAPASFENAYE